MIINAPADFRLVEQSNNSVKLMHKTTGRMVGVATCSRDDLPIAESEWLEQLEYQIVTRRREYRRDRLAARCGNNPAQYRAAMAEMRARGMFI